MPDFLAVPPAGTPHLLHGIAATAQPMLAAAGTVSAAEEAMIAQLLREILSSMRGDLSATETALLAEVEALAATVANARAEIAALQADDITASHIPSATDELDAIIAHTAQATETILEACESLDTIGPQISPEHGGTLQDATTKIYEACSFQDITGQRITKVVGTLKAIEGKVAHIMEVFGPHVAAAPRVEAGPAAPAAVAPAAEDEASLLNGPQLPSQAMGQSDIDALLASFD